MLLIVFSRVSGKYLQPPSGGGSQIIAYGVYIFAILTEGTGDQVIMRRGTTPTHTFVMPFNVESVQAVQIIYRQNGENILVLEKDDCILSGNTVVVHLTQRDTFEFTESANVEVQIRVLTADGEALASDVICIRCDRILTEDILA